MAEDTSLFFGVGPLGPFLVHKVKNAIVTSRLLELPLCRFDKIISSAVFKLPLTMCLSGSDKQGKHYFSFEACQFFSLIVSINCKYQVST